MSKCPNARARRSRYPGRVLGLGFITQDLRRTLRRLGRGRTGWTECPGRDRSVTCYTASAAQRGEQLVKRLAFKYFSQSKKKRNYYEADSECEVSIATIRMKILDVAEALVNEYAT